MLLKKHKKIALIFIQLVLFSVFIHYLIVHVDWSIVKGTVKKTNLFYFSLAVLAYLLKVILELFRWKFLLVIFNIRISLVKWFKNLMILPFFTIISFIPKADEVFLFYLIRNEKVSNPKTLSILFLNKIIALLTFMSILPFSFLYLKRYYDPLLIDKNVVIDVLYWGGLFLGGAILFYFIFIRLPKFKHFIREFWSTSMKALLLLKSSFVTTFYLFFITLVSYFAYGLTIYLLCLSLDISVSLLAIFLCVPITYLFSLIIIGIKGLGVKEAIWAFFMLLFSVSQSSALALSSLHFILSLLFIFIGLLLYGISKQQYGKEN